MVKECKEYRNSVFTLLYVFSTQCVALVCSCSHYVYLLRAYCKSAIHSTVEGSLQLLVLVVAQLFALYRI